MAFLDVGSTARSCLTRSDIVESVSDGANAAVPMIDEHYITMLANRDDVAVAPSFVASTHRIVSDDLTLGVLMRRDLYDLEVHGSCLNLTASTMNS